MKPSAKRFLSILMALALLFTTCLGILAEEAAIAPVSSAADGSEARGEAPIPEPADGDDAPAAVPGEAPIPEPADGDEAPVAAPGETPVPEPEDGDDVPTAALGETPVHEPADGDDAPAAAPGETPVPEPADGDDAPAAAPGETPVPEPADGNDAPAAAPGETPVPEPADGDDAPVAAPGETPVPEQDALQPTEAPAEQGQFAPFTIRHVEAEIDGETLRVLLVSDEAGYDRIYIGDRNAENKEPFYARGDGGDGTCLFRFPLPLSAMGETISFVPGCAGGAWYTEEVLTLDVPVVSAAQVTMKAAEEESAGIDYSTDVDSSSSMFKVEKCVLNIRGGGITAIITLSGTGYDKLFLGTPEAAAGADASRIIGYVANAEGKYTFTLPVSELDVPITVSAYAVKSAKWIERTLTFKSEPMKTTLEDGGYSAEVDSSSSMFKVEKCVLNIRAGKMTATITLSGTGYDKLFLGTPEAASGADASRIIGYVANAEGKYTFTLPVPALDIPIRFSAYAVKSAKWIERALTFKADSLKAAIADGDYTTDVDSSSSMFKVVSCTLNIRGGKIAATIALSGTGYDKLFVGTAAEAAAASEHIGYHLNGDGLYAFTLPVSELDVPITVSAYAVKSAKWVERSLTFKSGDMEAVDGGEATDPDDGGDDDEDGETVKPPEKDSSGSTSRVDNTTSLPDGTYKPEKFSFSGGTGRVRITCPAVTVRNGRSYATIVFSSPNYSYVKASGSKYYGSHGGGVSTFEIPVRLNASNTIIGMTTTMSSDHEIAYSIYIYIAGADGKKGEAQDEDAPAVVGLRYESADALESAERFNIYRYADGYVVLSVRDGADYLLVPEGAEVPAGLDEGMAVIKLPVANAYVASGNVLELMGMIGVIDPIALLGCETELPQIADALARGAIKRAGAYTEPDYGALLASGCTLAILPAEITDEAYAVLSERLGMLGIPAFVDRSAQESTEEGRLEWLKLYGVLFGCEDTVEAYFASLGAA